MVALVRTDQYKRALIVPVKTVWPNTSVKAAMVAPRPLEAAMQLTRDSYSYRKDRKAQREQVGVFKHLMWADVSSATKLEAVRKRFAEQCGPYS